MRRLLQPTLIMLLALFFASCSRGYYSHIPRAKKATVKNEVVDKKATEHTDEVTTLNTLSDVEPVAETKTAESNTTVSDEAQVSEVETTTTPAVETNAKRKDVKSGKVIGLAKTAMQAPVNHVKQLVKPGKSAKTMNVSNTTALLFIVLGLVLGVLADGGLASIGSILVLIGVILLILNIFGVEY